MAKGAKKLYISKKGHRVRCVHEDGVFPYIGKIVEDFDPELIIETGHAWGGMTLLFHDYAPKAEIHAFNLECPRKPNLSFFNTKKVHFHYKDILSKPLPILVNLFKDERKKFVYLDNGNKLREFLLYAVHLNIGDMVGVHDWPREIYTEYVHPPAGKMMKRTTKEEVERFKKVLEDFEMLPYEFFEKNLWSSRFWKRIKK